MAKRRGALKDDLDPATAYAKAVGAGEIVAGPLVRLACERHLRDLSDGGARGLSWHPEIAQRAIDFFADILRLSDGQFAGQPFALAPFQKFKLGSLFGWLNADGFRRFRFAYIEEGKGNGKSPFGAGVGLYMLTADGEQAAQCFTAAVTHDQARIPFQDAVHMIEASAELRARVQISGKSAPHNLAHVESGSFFRPLSSEGKSLDGKRPHFALIDELHEHPTGIVVEKLRLGTKARRQPLIMAITNSGVDRTSVCFQYHEYAERVLRGEQLDDEFFAYVCALDEDDEPLKDETCWIKANPNLGTSILPQYLRGVVREAVGMPAKESIVRRLNFCQWVGADSPAIASDSWHARQHHFGHKRFIGEAIKAALDLSGKRDLSALAYGSLDEPANVIRARVEFWTPKDTLEERSRHDRVPYDTWVEHGFITATPGRVVDYRFIAQRLIELDAECHLEEVAFDPWRIDYLQKVLDELGATIKLVPHPQGYFRTAAKKDESGDELPSLWMPRSVEVLLDRLDSGGIEIDESPCLTHNAASAVIEADPKNNIIFTKRKSRGKIDGVVTLAMLCGLFDAGIEPPTKSVYETRGIISI